MLENKEEYRTTFALYMRGVKIILLQFILYQERTSLKDIFIKNTIARALASVDAIITLYSMHNETDGWIILRCLLDRLFHLRHLENTNSYEEFNKWSFIKKYEYMNDINSDTLMKSKLEKSFFQAFHKSKNQYNLYKRKNINWNRGKAEKLSKDMNMPFLYKFGYDYASAFIHPMADDGEKDFNNIFKLEKDHPEADGRLLLNNAYSCIRNDYTRRIE